MMPPDVSSVVDPRLRVYGARNMRVVDASIVPLDVIGITYAIAEKAADLIKQDIKTTGMAPQIFVGAAEAMVVDRIILLLLLVSMAVFWLV